MKLVEQALKYGVTVAVGVILILMFGIMSLLRIPVQLTPEISQPELSIRTTWPGARNGFAGMSNGYHSSTGTIHSATLAPPGQAILGRSGSIDQS